MRQREAAAGIAAGQRRDRAEQAFDAFAADRNDRYHRAAGLFGQCLDVDINTAAARHVHHIERDHHRHAHLQHLHAEVEIAFQVGSVEHVDDQVGVARQQVVAGDFLVQRGSIQGIDAGQVDRGDRFAIEGKAALLAIHGNARPVAGTLTDPGEHVEQRGFAAVGIAREGDGQLAVAAARERLFTGFAGHRFSDPGCRRCLRAAVASGVSRRSPRPAPGGCLRAWPPPRHGCDAAAG